MQNLFEKFCLLREKRYRMAFRFGLCFIASEYWTSSLSDHKNINHASEMVHKHEDLVSSSLRSWKIYWFVKYFSIRSCISQIELFRLHFCFFPQRSFDCNVENVNRRSSADVNITNKTEIYKLHDKLFYFTFLSPLLSLAFQRVKRKTK